ncbi:MAG: caspase family protein [Planctomycetota bacterium]|nr:caspase family protein [Planctomycetota bacterium]
MDETGIRQAVVRGGGIRGHATGGPSRAAENIDSGRRTVLRIAAASVLVALAVAGCSKKDSNARSIPRAGTSVTDTASEDAPSQDGRLLALLIGVNAYEHVKSLHFCVNDMESLRAVLVQHAGYKPEHVTLLVDGRSAGKPPTQEAIRQALRSLQETAAKTDTILFAFSGHGMADGDLGYLLPQDANPADLVGTAVAIREVHAALNQSRAAAKFLIVDACHAGGTRDAADSAQLGVDHSLFADQDGQICSLFSCTKKQESMEQAELDAGFGRKGHGVFSYFLVKALQGAADENGNGVVEFAEVTNYLNNQVPPYVKQRWQQQQTPFQFSRSTGSVIMARVSNSAGLPPEAAADADVELLTLPGLNGEWWAQEAPWLLPQVRQNLAKHLPTDKDAAQSAGDPAARQEPRPPMGSERQVSTASGRLRQSGAAGVYQWLERGFEQFVRSQPASQQPPWRAVTELLGAESGDVDVGQFRKYGASLFSQQDPVGLHSAAVGDHRLAIARKLPWEEVFHAYEEAIRAYEGRGGRPAGLFALCLADYGQALSDNGRHRDGAENFALARTRVAETAAPLFHVAGLCQEANARRKLCDWDQVAACLQEAQRLSSERLPSSHPLGIFLHKSRAWSYMDQWRIREAREAFGLTMQLLDAYHVEHPEDRSLARIVNVFHNRHGLAMADRYSGDLPSAIHQYEQLRRDMEHEVPQWSDDKDQPALRERLVNTLERLADCRLQLRDVRAVDDLRSAKLENEGLTRSRTLEDQGSLLCKRALALGWEGQSGEAAEELAEFDRLFKSRRFPRLDALRNIAGILVKLSEPQGDQAAQELRGVLEKVCDDNANAKFDRDQLDLYLLAARELIRQQAHDPAATARNAKQLFDLVPKSNRGFSHPASLAYRRHYYDAALVAWLAIPEPKDLDEALDYLAFAKTNEYYGELVDKTVLMFHFPEDKRQSGCAILYDDQHGGKIFRMDRPADKGPLPAPLAELIAQSVLPLEVQWRDDVLGLKNEDFPYALEKPFRFHGE